MCKNTMIMCGIVHIFTFYVAVFSVSFVCKIVRMRLYVAYYFYAWHRNRTILKLCLSIVCAYTSLLHRNTLTFLFLLNISSNAMQILKFLYYPLSRIVAIAI